MIAGPEIAAMKTCSTCHALKPLADFKRQTRGDGHRAGCRACCADARLERTARDRAKRGLPSLRREQLLARLPVGECLCGHHLAIHHGVGRCHLCGCPGFHEEGT